MNSQETQVDAKKIAKFLLETKAVFLSPQEPSEELWNQINMFP